MKAADCELDERVTSLTPAERRAAATALREWLATYSQGVRPGDYEAAQSALAKMEADDGKDSEEN